jgi:cytochrome c oxidase subunit 2
MTLKLHRILAVGLTVFTLGFSHVSYGLIESSATGLPVSEETIKAGESLYKKKCAACHALDRDMTGPALSGVTERRDMDWLIKWIRNNVELRNSGDADAIAIYNEWNQSAMTVFADLTDDEIKSILMYTENGPIASAAAAEEVVAPVEVDESVFNKINWLLVLLSLLVFVVIVFLIKTIDLVGKLTKREVIPWNDVNATLFLLFLVIGMGAAFWEVSIHGKYTLLSGASSEHGGAIDQMMAITFIITGIVFVVTQILLFWFTFKYRKKVGRKALYYPHNNKLEMIWTVIPAIVLTVLVLGGLNAWQDINETPEEGTPSIEVFAYQFGWQARYPGPDGKLGLANYNLISETSNPLGVAAKHKTKVLLEELQGDTARLNKEIDNLPAKLGELKGSVGGLVGKKEEQIRKQIEAIESGEKQAELELQLRRRNTQMRRIQEAMAADVIYDGAGLDDQVTDTIFLVKDKTVTLKFRARDVIHSALMKEFRAQMNVVPGVPTQFTFKPIKTTQERRDELGNQEFDYHIICNKICGSSHYNMKIPIVVGTQDQYNQWIKAQKATYALEETPAETPKAETEEEVIAIN